MSNPQKLGEVYIINMLDLDEFIFHAYLKKIIILQFIIEIDEKKKIINASKCDLAFAIIITLILLRNRQRNTIV